MIRANGETRVRKSSATNRPRRSVRLSIDDALIAEAKALGVDVARAAESGIARAVAEEKGRRWKIENAEAIREWNEWVRNNGLPLEGYRQF